MKALVIGSAHLDVLARPFFDSGHKDRIGEVMIEVGGTACNAALGLRKAGMEVRFLTAWGDLPISRLISNYIKDAGIELVAKIVPGMPPGAFVGLLSMAGDLNSAVSSMPVEQIRFDDDLISEAMAGVDCVLIDANLSDKAIGTVGTLADSLGLPLFVLGVSEEKVGKVLSCKGKFEALFLNEIESAHLCKICDAEDESELAVKLEGAIVRTLGERGAAYYAPGEAPRFWQAAKLENVSTLMGLGDAFAAGVIHAFMQYGMGFEDAAAFAHGIVAVTAKESGCTSSNGFNKLVGTLFETARRDVLTGMFNRRFFEDDFPRYAKSENSLLIIDCDRFKDVNDRYGHDAGDQVLRTVAMIILETVRSTDLPCRWGGDEFAVLLPRTDPVSARSIAVRLREIAENIDLMGVTLSIGVVSVPIEADIASVFKNADKALYEAKKQGRNTVVCA